MDNKYFIDLKNVNSDEEMHNRLKEELNFESYYGKNLDALNDSLSELQSDSIVYFYVYDDITIDLEKFLKIFRDCNVKYEIIHIKSNDIST